MKTAVGMSRRRPRRLQTISKALGISSATCAEARGTTLALVPLPNRRAVLGREGSPEPRKGVLRVRAAARVARMASLVRYAQLAAKRGTGRLLDGRPILS